MSKKLTILLFVIIPCFIFSFPPQNISCTAIEPVPNPISVGIYDNYPYAYQTNSGEYEGIYVDLLKYISQSEGWTITWVFDSWENLLDRLDSATLDIMTIIAFSEKRAEKYDFNNQSVLIDWGNLYTSTNLNIKDVYELENLSIGILPNDIYYIGDEGLEFLLNSMNVHCQILNYSSYPAIAEALSNDTLDVGLLDRNYGFFAETEYDIKRTPIIFQPTELFFAFPKSHEYNSVLISQIDALLYSLKEDKNSLYYQVLTRYLSPELQKGFPLWAKIALGSVGGIALIFGLNVLYLNQLVKKRTKALRREEFRFKEVVDYVYDGIITTDNSGLVHIANPAALKMLESKFNDIKNKPISQILQVFTATEEKTPLSLEEIRSSNSIFRRISQECVLRTKFGNYIFIKLWVCPIPETDEEPEGWIYIIRDITKEKTIDNELIKSERLHSIQLLAGGISHDLNNYLTALTGNLSLISEIGFEGEDSKDIIEEISEAVKKTTKLTRQLQELTKGKPPIKEPANFIELISKTVKFHLRGTNIRLYLEADEGLPAIEVDKDQISEVFGNLTLNAIDAIKATENFEAEGEIHVKIERLTAGKGPEFLNSSLDFIKICFSDTGCGIPPENLSKLFNPFYTTKSQGTGLGLLLCQSIIHKHNGHILVKSPSIKGKGTTFEIFLPVNIMESHNSITANEKQAKKSGFWEIQRRRSYKNDQFTNGEKISYGEEFPHRLNALILEDEPIVQTIYKKISEKLNIKVDIVEDGADIFEKCQKSPKYLKKYDFIILDLTIPKGLGGIPTVKQIREIDNNIPIIAASGFLKNNVKFENNKHLFSDFLQKPFEIRDIQLILEKLGFNLSEF